MRSLSRLDREYANGAVLRALTLASLALFAAGVSAAPVETETLRLRVYWGGGDTHRWSGKISAAGGEVGQVGRLATGPFAAATIYEADGAIRIRSGPRTTHNALDLTLTIGEAQRLQIELSPDGGDLQSFELPIDTLLASPYSASLNGNAGRLAVHRLTDDQLRIDIGRESTIFSPGEQVDVKLDAVLADVEPLSPIDVTVELRTGRNGGAVSGETKRLEFPVRGPATLATSIKLPDQEGVYTIHVAAVRPPGLTKVFLPRSTGKVMAERSFQVLVWDADRRQQLEDNGSLLAEIDPSTPRWWERVPRWVWPRRLARPEQHHGSAEPVVVASGDRLLVELPAIPSTTGDARGEWHAYPLPVAGAGLPHIVEVDYPVDRPQTLTISVLDRDAFGDNAPLGPSDEVFVGDWPTVDPANNETAAPAMRTMRRLFWPSTGAPFLLLSNHSDSPARFGRIRVYRLAQNEQSSATANRPRPASLVGLTVTSPRLADAVGASLAAASDGTFAYDDWQTWIETASRLADLVELGGYNAAAVTAASAQGPIYPSSVFADTPGADRESLAHGAVDLPRKDLLELLFLEFDRRGLRLVPVVAFDAAVPGLEAALDPKVMREPSPIYDPLRPEVSTMMCGAVAELVDRYGAHPSFAAIAVDVGAGGERGYGALPVASFGQTREQVDRFLASSGLAWPANVPRNVDTTAIALAGPWRTAWQEWRRLQMNEGYRSLSVAANHGASSRRLFVLTHELTKRSSTRRLFTPTLGSEIAYGEVLSSAGIDEPVLQGEHSIDVVAAWELVGGRRLATQPMARVANRLLTESAERSTASSAMLVRRTVERRLAPPLANDRLTDPMPSLTAVSSSSVGAAAYTDLLAAAPAGDLFDGGAAVTHIVQADAVDLRRQLAENDQPMSHRPALDKAKIVTEQPLLVRTVSSNSGVVVQLVNRLPWEVDAAATIEASAGCLGRWQIDDSIRFDTGHHVLSRVVPPYGVEECRFDSTEVKVLGVRSKLPAFVASILAERLEDLKRRDLGFQRRYNAVANLSFEDLDGDGRLIGWEAVVGDGAVRLTDRDPKQGAVALLVENPAGASGVTLQTAPVAAPETGQLAVTFNLRPESVTADTRVSVRFEEIGGGYVSSTTLDAERLRGDTLSFPGQVSSDAEWRRPFVFAASDVPIGGDRPLRLVFEISGEATIAVDDLAMYDLVFPLDLGAQSDRQKFALLKILRDAESALERGELGKCYDILDGYWPRFLQAYTPLLPEPSPETVVDADKPQAVEDEAEAEVSSGWRSYLPRFWR